MAHSSTQAAAVMKCHTAAFLLKGKVQGVKMRRYVESAAKHFGVGGYVINIQDDEDDGAVFGEAWVGHDDNHNKNHPSLDSFVTWIRGKWEPATYTNIKPTPIGTAYPEKARVDQVAVWNHYDDISRNNFQNYAQFCMIRNDQEAAVLSSDRRHVRRQLSTALVQGTHAEATHSSNSHGIIVGSWPERQ